MTSNSHPIEKKKSKRWKRWFWLLVALLLLLLPQGSAIHPDNLFSQQAGIFTAGKYFDFVGWELKAAGIKAAQAAAPTHWQLNNNQRQALVRTFFDHLEQIHDLENRIEQQYATLTGQALIDAVTLMKEELAELRRQQLDRQPLVEAILEEQITTILVDEGFAPAGILLPPLRFHFTQTPLYLIISPRDEIVTKYGTMLRADIPVEEQIALEESIDNALDVSSLVDKVGGLGIYPTMVIESSWLPWVIDTIAHEWSHNYLFLRPLGWHYADSGQLTTINETVASIFGQEIGQKVLERYYPEYAPKKIKRRHNIGWEPPPQAPYAFDFGREMRETRLQVDKLLAEGKIKEAEEYMQDRRLIFIENGYLYLRKLNQAYFAFHGSYATGPGAIDPIGPLLKRLRLRHDSLKSFTDAIQGITTYDDLEQILAEGS